MENPFPYPLCVQTVTVYHKDGDTVSRRVARDCFYRWEDVCTEDGQGLRTRRKCLLIQPGENPIYPGDKILSGEGPVIDASRWEEFTPGAVPGLSVAAYAQGWYWQGKICHYEAGWK